MQEQQVTIGDDSYPLERPFLVLATQNPIEQEGTYPLPEAQLDRFMFKVKLTYPSKADELMILDRMAGIAPDLSVNSVLSPADVLALQQTVDRVYVDDQDQELCPRPGSCDPPAQRIRFGCRPADSIWGQPAGDAVPDPSGQGAGVSRRPGIRDAARREDRRPDVLRHRLLVTYEAEAEEVTAEGILDRVLAGVPAP